MDKRPAADINPRKAPANRQLFSNGSCEKCGRQVYDLASVAAELRTANRLTHTVLTALKQLSDEVNDKRSDDFLERLAIDQGKHTHIVPVSEVLYVRASGEQAEVHTENGVFSITAKMKKIETWLDPRHFCRVHRSWIVNLEQVDGITSRRNGSCHVSLKNGSTLPASRSRREALEERLRTNL